MIHIYAQLYDQDALADVQKMVEADTDGVGADIDRLPADADEDTRQRLVERLARTLAQHFIDYPWLSDPAAHLSKSPHVTARTIVDSVVDLYNPAQLDVLVRANTLANDQVRALREQSGQADEGRAPRGA
ncbi:hypothetical protein ABGB14_49080 [Nonomuraea sp. B10E15]|uniref:hypothetical protein n=1 Tax=Nonomuraea sp. B10E15 TaxID=3153560 RepID=UPI00325CD427